MLTVTVTGRQFFSSTSTTSILSPLMAWSAPITPLCQVFEKNFMIRVWSQVYNSAYGLVSIVTSQSTEPLICDPCHLPSTSQPCILSYVIQDQGFAII